MPPPGPPRASCRRRPSDDLQDLPRHAQRQVLRHRANRSANPVRDRGRDARARRQDHRALGRRQSLFPHATTRRAFRHAEGIKHRTEEEMSVRIGIIGAGNIGLAVAKTLSRAGIAATIANSRGPDSLKEAVAALGPTIKAGTREQAAAADIVLIAVHWSQLAAGGGGAA